MPVHYDALTDTIVIWDGDIHGGLHGYVGGGDERGSLNTFKLSNAIDEAS